jgi:hypothetical protein
MNKLELIKICNKEDFSWIKVKVYVENPDDTTEQSYQKLLEHHKIETEFLLSKCRELAVMLETSIKV